MYIHSSVANKKSIARPSYGTTYDVQSFSRFGWGLREFMKYICFVCIVATLLDKIVLRYNIFNFYGISPRYGT